MVFADGTDKDNWKWAAVKAVELTKEEKESDKFPKEQTHKMDMTSLKSFSEREYMDALSFIGILPE